jgi:hypothetical protein
MDLNDVLSDKVEAPAPVEAPVEKAEVDPGVRVRHQQREALAVEEGKPRDPASGKFVKEKAEAKVEEKPVEVKPPVQEMTEKERGFLRGLEEERRKRQDLERQIAELRKPPEKQEEKKTFWDDPEGHFNKFEQRLSQREQALALQVSERLARSRYNDFDEKFGEFLESAKATPGLREQCLAAQDPAEFAYKHAQRIKEMRDVGDIDKFREKIEKETRAKLEAEFKAKQDELEKKRAELPGSLSDVRGTTTQQKPVYAGPTSLDDILGRKS